MITTVNNLIDLDKSKKEELAEFNKVESGTDCTFDHLPPEAKRAAYEIMANFDTYNSVKREIDRCYDFRDALKPKYPSVDVHDVDFVPQETDSVMRYWSWKYEVVVA